MVTQPFVGGRVGIVVLSLKLLGTFRFCDDQGVELRLRQRKERGLLAYLATQPGKAVSRDRITTLLWGDRDPRQARQSLNNALLSIRRLGSERDLELIESDREVVCLVAGSIDIDVAAFQQLQTADPEKAAALYEGPFLDGLSIPDNAFEEWLLATRSEYHNAVCDVLRNSADDALEAGDTQTAMTTLRKALKLEPLLEDVHRRLMQALHASGDRAGALRQYEICADILQRELEIKPEAETERLLARIKGTIENHGIQPAQVIEHNGHRSPNARANRPSIAVLPLENLSGHREHEYFADGIAEDLIAELTRFKSLFVIDRRSSFSYRGQFVQVQDVAKSLGIRYAITGSIRISGRRLRIAMQLVEAVTGEQIWSERFDRKIDDIFSVQDEISEAIVSTFEVQIGSMERQMAARKRPDQLDAWGHYQKGLWHLHRTTRTNNIEARQCVERSIELDAEFSLAYSALSQIYLQQAALGWSTDAEAAYKQARLSAEKAVQIDPYDAQAHVALGRAYMLQGESEAGLAEFREALELNSNSAFAYHRLGAALVFAGRARNALSPLRAAVRQSPRDPERYRLDRIIGIAHFMLREHEDALHWLQASARQAGNDYWTHLGLAANYAAIDNLGLSKASLREALKIRPDLTVELAAYYLRGQCAEYSNFYFDQLRKAGLPE